MFARQNAGFGQAQPNVALPGGRGGRGGFGRRQAQNIPAPAAPPIALAASAAAAEKKEEKEMTPQERSLRIEKLTSRLKLMVKEIDAWGKHVTGSANQDTSEASVVDAYG